MSDSPTAKTSTALAWGLLWGLAGALTLGLALTILVPWQPGYPHLLTLDGSWVMVLNEAYARGWRFGSDLMFTYGPFGFIAAGVYHPATGNAMLALWALFALGFWGVLFALARALVPNGLLAALALTAVVGIASVSTDGYLLAMAALVPIAYLALDRRETPVLYAAAALAGLAGLVKFSFFVAAAMAVAGVAVDVAVRHRRVPIAPAAFAAAFLLGWIAVGQSLVDVPAYLFTSVEIARAYASTMALDGPMGELWVCVALIAAFVAFAFAAARPGPLPVALGLAGWALVAFKAGFVRHDGHSMATATALYAVLIAYGAFVAPKRHGTLVKIAFACVFVAATINFSAVVHTYHHIHLSTFLFEKLTAEPIADAKAALAIARGDDGREAQYHANLERVRARNPIPIPAGTVDVFQSLSGVALAHGLDYRPRPVFQSYAAYTETLARYNAEYLASDRAPQFLLFHITAIDVHVPASEDALSWPVLLSRYVLRDMQNGYLLLERRQAPRPVTIADVSSQPAVLRGSYKVPVVDSDMVWVQISARKTPVGTLRNLFFQISPLVLRVELEDGEKREFRLPIGMAEAGFILSPNVGDEVSFARLLVGEWPRRQRVVRLSLTTLPGGEGLYEESYTLSFKRVHVERDGSGEDHWPKFMTLARLSTPHKLRNVELQQDPAGRPIVSAHAPSTATLDAPAGPFRLRVRFGILEEAWTGKGNTTGVEFRVSVGTGASARTLWSRVLDPKRLPSDRGDHEAVVDVPDGVAGPLRFETLPGADGAWDWSYWSDVEVVELSSPTAP
jgi:hypothetical protein